MDNVKVSFIVVSYNEKEYINEAINSILDLNINYNYEIIIGDDGSSDGSIDIIKDLKNKYNDKIKYFVMDREEGLTSKDVIGAIRCSNVIKKGIEISSGDYILLLSADDYYVNKNFVNEAIDFMDNNKKYVALAFDGYNLNKNKKIEYFDYPNSLFWSREYIHLSNYFIRNTEEFRKSLLNYFCDDTGMVYSLLTIGKVKYNNNKIHEYRVNENGIMKSSDFNELMLMELMLHQDIINNGNKYKISNVRRFWYTLYNLYHDKDKLDNPKYKKYIDHIKNNKNDIYTKYMNSNILYRFFYLIRAYIIITYFYVRRKLWKIM